jgi:hypothetical protein
MSTVCFQNGHRTPRPTSLPPIDVALHENWEGPRPRGPRIRAIVHLGTRPLRPAALQSALLPLPESLGREPEFFAEGG